MKQVRTTRRTLLAALLGLTLTAPALAAGGVEASEAWIRWLPAGLPAGGYVTLRNQSDHAVDLVGASSPAYASVMLHQSVRQGDRMEMKMVSKVTIPAHGRLDFKPGSYHIMLMQPTRDIKPGDHVPVELRLSGGATLHVDFDVRKSDAEGAGRGTDMKGMDMKGMDMKGMGGMSAGDAAGH